MSAFVLSEFLPYRIVSLGDRLSRALGGAYADEGVSIPEWRVLAVISQQPRMAARDVVAMTPLDKMAVSRAVAALEEKGLVRRTEDPDDRRVAILSLSPEGRVVFNRIAALALDFERRLLDDLSVDEQKRLRAALAQLEAALSAPA
ncbi:MAG: MarR family transcriptional regulator [Parvularculaceae bacterium]|nr:MarR family transcriptional regulator [Parvularculaceae bacterium]